MNPNDLINGVLFEGCGALLVWLNVRAILRDRTTVGVDWRVSAFFTVWGFWNLYYYDSLEQPVSAYAALLVALGNGSWVCLALWSRRQARRLETRLEPSDDHLLHRAVAYVRPSSSRNPRPRWSLVRDLFNVGSTTARQLCRRFELDPEELVRK